MLPGTAVRLVWCDPHIVTMGAGTKPPTSVGSSESWWQTDRGSAAGAARRGVSATTGSGRFTPVVSIAFDLHMEFEGEYRITRYTSPKSIHGQAASSWQVLQSWYTVV